MSDHMIVSQEESLLDRTPKGRNEGATESPGYYTPFRYVDVIERGGFAATFESWRRPLAAYTQALESAGLVIEAMREPRPDDHALSVAPELAKWREQPIFLHIRPRASH
jgi:hypothetical protein